VCAGPPALGEEDADCAPGCPNGLAPIKVEVLGPDLQRLADAEAGAIEERQQGAVAPARQRPGVARIEQRPDLFGVEHLGREAADVHGAAGSGGVGDGDVHGAGSDPRPPVGVRGGVSRPSISVPSFDREMYGLDKYAAR